MWMCCRIPCPAYREGSSVAGPAAAVREEEVCLCGAGAGSRAGEMVAASDEAGGGGAVVVLGEFGVDVGCAFGGLRVCVCQRLWSEGIRSRVKGILVTVP